MYSFSISNQDYFSYPLFLVCERIYHKMIRKKKLLSPQKDMDYAGMDWEVCGSVTKKGELLRICMERHFLSENPVTGDVPPMIALRSPQIRVTG